MKTNKIFVDTSFFKGMADLNDDFHEASIKILKKLKDQNFEFITTNFILDETYTLIRKRCGYQDAIDFHDGLGRSFLNLVILRVEIDDEILAWKLFQEDWSKLSFTDCTSFAIMKRIGLKEVATFDDHFSRAGFTIFK